MVIGVGNAYRGDDGAGLAVAERLRGPRARRASTVLECEQEPTRLIDAWEDARRGGRRRRRRVGSGAGHAAPLRRERRSRVPARVFRSSTHAFGVGDAIELARALGRLPERVVVYGVEGAAFAAGADSHRRWRRRSTGSSRPSWTTSAADPRGGAVHERALMRDVMRKIEEVARAGGATRVTRVRVRLGALSHFTPEHFREHFEDAARGTVADGAEVDALPDDDLTDAGARDVVVESVEVEVPDLAEAT